MHAHINCFCGAAGDMLNAALIDCGLDVKELEDAFKTLNLPEFRGIKTEKVIRSGISAVKFTPLFDEPDHHHHHDSDDHHHDHGHKHSHGHHHHHAPHRNLPDITEIINASGLPDKVKKDAIGVFELLAVAEAKVHGKGINEVHFHEVGATDSILDIIGVCFGFYRLGIDTASAYPINVGGGTVKCAHGIMPVPAPATLNLLEGIPFRSGPVEKELLTPTAAALLKYFVTDFAPMPQMTIKSSGYGAGTFEFDNVPNTTLITIASAGEDSQIVTDNVVMLETDIDDAPGEIVGGTVEQLRTAGALDVLTIPVFMKNSRPGTRLSVLAKPKDSAQLEGIIFQSGITLGIRRQNVTRSTLPREIVTVQTPYGSIEVKTATYNGVQVFAKPEFKQCASAAQKHNVPIKTVSAAALENLKK